MWKNVIRSANSPRILWTACAAVFLVLAFSAFYFTFRIYPQLSRAQFADIPSLAPIVPSVPPPAEYTLVFVGDIMLSRQVGTVTAQKGDWRWPFLNIADTLRSADITFGNLESPISSRGVRVGSIYSFRADPRMVQGLTHAGFDVLSVANNHAWDYGRQAFTDTLAHLASAGIDVVGGGENSDIAHAGIVRALPDGTRVAFLAYTDLLSQKISATKTAPGVAVYREEEMIKDIREATGRADIVLVSFHTGDEYKLLHNAHQETIYKKAIDAGADMIIGHHPHVVQDIRQYGGGWIIYSLGNFVFDQSFSRETMTGMLLLVVVRDGAVSEVIPEQVFISKEFQPGIAGQP